MTEEKAKEILGFLAKRSGYQTTLTFEKNNLHDDSDELWHLELCFLVYEKTIRQHFLVKKTHLETTNFGDPISIGSCSFKKYLDKLLELSRNGYDIKMFASNKMFLDKFTRLEEILIEMDLKTELPEEEEKDD